MSWHIHMSGIDVRGSKQFRTCIAGMQNLFDMKIIVNQTFQRYTKRNVTSSSWMFRSWEHINGGG